MRPSISKLCVEPILQDYSNYLRLDESRSSHYIQFFNSLEFSLASLGYCRDLQGLVIDVTEMYNQSTDGKQLIVLLEEGRDHLQYKDQIIEFFTCIRDRISIEDLSKVCGISTNKTERTNEISIS